MKSSHVSFKDHFCIFLDAANSWPPAPNTKVPKKHWCRKPLVCLIFWSSLCYGKHSTLPWRPPDFLAWVNALHTNSNQLLFVADDCFCQSFLPLSLPFNTMDLFINWFCMLSYFRMDNCISIANSFQLWFPPSLENWLPFSSDDSGI